MSICVKVYSFANPSIFVFSNMGDIKHAKKSSNEQDITRSNVTEDICARTHSVEKCTHSVAWTISFLMLMVALGIVNVFQLNEILCLKRRVEYLERSAFGFELNVSKITEILPFYRQFTSNGERKFSQNVGIREHVASVPDHFSAPFSVPPKIA